MNENIKKFQDTENETKKNLSPNRIECRKSKEKKSRADQSQISQDLKKKEYMKSPEIFPMPKGCGDIYSIKLSEACASESRDFQAILAVMIGQLMPKSDKVVANAALAVMRGLEPKDEIEAMLISQMFATNFIAMEFAGRILKQTSPNLIELHVNGMNKLIGRFTENMDALNKHRGKGQQKVTVEHVNVQAGGQAIVGTLNTTGGGRGK